MMRPRFYILFLAIFGCGDASVSGITGTANEIRVLADRYEFQGDVYSSSSELAAALHGSPDLAFTVLVSDCASEASVGR